MRKSCQFLKSYSVVNQCGKNKDLTTQMTGLNIWQSSMLLHYIYPSTLEFLIQFGQKVLKFIFYCSNSRLYECIYVFVFFSKSFLFNMNMFILNI